MGESSSATNEYESETADGEGAGDIGESASGQDSSGLPSQQQPESCTDKEGLFLSQAEALRSSGSLSAPPPPGFDGPNPAERTRQVKQLLWTDSGDLSDNANGMLSSTPTSYQVNGKRTTSFANLAAVLGTSLTESMDDATRDQKALNDTKDLHGGDVLFDPTHELSYTRQSRHAASRMVGASLGAVGSGHGLKLPLSSSFGSKKEELFGDSATLGAAEDRLSELKPSTQYGQNTSVPMFAGASDRSLPPKDLGLTVMEPSENHSRRRSAPPDRLVDGMLSRRTHSDTPLSLYYEYELERGVHQLSIEQVRGARSPASPLDMSQRRRESELLPFMWDVRDAEPSRALVILRASSLYIPDVRSTCEAFGVLQAFRSDFADYGIIFVSYFDMRSAKYAALELQPCLKRLGSPDRPADDVQVQYCVPLNASSALDESILHLSEVPPGINEDNISSMLSSFGAVRSLRRIASDYGSVSYAVAFHNVQDAKQALLELESTQPWGSDVIVEVGTRSSIERKRGRELLALIGRWRQSLSVARQRLGQSADGLRASSPAGVPVGRHSGIGVTIRTDSSSSSSPIVAGPDSLPYGHHPATETAQESLDDTNSSTHSLPTTQLVLGPDGRYSYVVVNRSAYLPVHVPADPHANVQVVNAPQHVVHGLYSSYVTSGVQLSSNTTPAPGQPAGSYWPHQTPASHIYHVAPGPAVATGAPASAAYPGANPNAVPFYAHVMPNPTDSSISSAGSQHAAAMGSSHPRRVIASMEEKDNRHLMLDIEAVESGRDTRTSLMVRNIPNKYTQHMLLSELTDNGYGPGKIDFFYLPIDFKNRCNRGYAFVNFVDYRDIVPFYRQYFGQHWRVFNSEKICDVTYARIQGKAGMLKRFENSALMEKDDEYKPLVFVSHGVDKGKRVPFP